MSNYQDVKIIQNALKDPNPNDNRPPWPVIVFAILFLMILMGG